MTCTYQVNEQRDIDMKLRTVLRNTREMVICFKKMSVITESNTTDSLALVPSTLMQVMTLERSVSIQSHRVYLIYNFTV